MTVRPFCFLLLDEQVSHYLKDTDAGGQSGWLERWSLVVGCAATGAGLVFAKVFSDKLALVLVSGAFALEIIGLGVGLACVVRREWQGFRQAHARLAHELDRSYGHFCRLVAALRRYPRVELRSHLRYLRGRKAAFAYRTSLLAGGMERLGVLPILAVLYVQLKDWRFGDWVSLWSNVHLVGGLLLWALLLVYLLSWWMIRLRGRLDLYEEILTEALAEDDA
jgi:hypothetical protein